MRLCTLLGIKYPIIQAPMAGSDTPELAAAVSNAGALGSLGAQYKTPEQIRNAIKEIRFRTDKPFGVNLFALPPSAPPSSAEMDAARQEVKADYEAFSLPLPDDQTISGQIDADAQLEVLLEQKIPVFSFTLGMLSPKRLSDFKQAGTIVIGTATNLKEASLLADAGVDAIVIQGCEAGGHRGTFIGSFENSMIGLMALIPQIADATKLPLIAAGGIMDGRGLAASLALGADGIQMGTAFLTTVECSVHHNYKQRIMWSHAEDTAITKVFSGGAARGITNHYMQAHAGDTTLLPFPFHNSVTRPLRNYANSKGELEYTNLWCGQAGRLAKTISCKELVEQTVSQANEICARIRIT